MIFRSRAEGPALRTFSFFLGLTLSSVAAYSQVLDSFNPNPDNVVYTSAVQYDGRILAGGVFSYLSAQSHNRIGRLLPDGSVDSSLNPSAGNTIYCLAALADGKTVVGGAFASLGGYSRPYIGRLNSDGLVDTNFNPKANNTVYCLLVQTDGGMIVGGSFTSMGNQTRNYLARLNPDGTLDTALNPGANGAVYCLAVQQNGQILVGGNFTKLAGQTHSYLGRLNADGTLDTTFNPGANGPVYCLAVQADDSILVGGHFTTLCGQARNNLGRLAADGTLDTSFNPGPDTSVCSLAIQTDGRILAGGQFTRLCGSTANYLGRLNSDGTLDATWNPGASSLVYSLALQSDGKVVVGGAFNQLAGQYRSKLGRLNNTEPATEDLVYDGWNITWLRGGTGPEVLRASFQASTNSTDWFDVGVGQRIPGGWQLAGVALPTGASIRAQATAAGGYQNGSSWTVQSVTGPPVLVTQPSSRTNAPLTSATFFAGVLGSQPLSYQWYKDQAPLQNGGKVSGAQTSILKVNSALGSEAGGYWVVVSNLLGSVTSRVASLSVHEPVWYDQPASQTCSAGTNATFTASALGSQPLSLQWRKDGADLIDGGAISGARTATLVVQSVLRADAGNYSVVASNAYGTITSQLASLTVIEPVICAPPVSQTVLLGGTAVFNVTPAGTPPLSFQWRKNGLAMPDGTAAILTLRNVQLSDVGSYDVVVTNQFGSVTSAVAVLTPSSAAPDAWSPQVSSASCLAVQPDGRVLVGGSFTNLCGAARNCLGRLNADGTLDAGFNTDIASGSYPSVSAIVVQPDGKILIGGRFTLQTFNTYSNLVRLNPDGTLDPQFNPLMTGQVYCLVPQADGKILVGGYFISLGGQTRNHLGRLNADGTLDTTFNPGATSEVFSMVVQPDGKILAGGGFDWLGGQGHQNIGRLNADGTPDGAFNPTASDRVTSLALQPDGKILVAGYFTNLCGQARQQFGRLNADGTLDPDFIILPGCSPSPSSLAVQADGKILMAGQTILAGQLYNGIRRFNPDGTLDPTFNIETDSLAYCMALLPDARLLCGGYFNRLGDQARQGLARLVSTDTATQEIRVSGSTITWLRNGMTPEIGSATFERSSDGSNWIGLGNGTRISGGWKLDGVSLNSGDQVRARGFVPSIGGLQGSSWFVESIYRVVPPSPVIVTGDGTLGFTNNQFAFRIRALPGQTLVIEASTDLSHWASLQTNLTTSAGEVLFSDPDPQHYQRRFYRARVQ